MSGGNASAGLVAQFIDGAKRFRWMGSPLYGALCRHAADDEDILQIAAEAPAGQPSTHLLFAAVHALILAGKCVNLAAYYGSVNDQPNLDYDDAFAHFRTVCRDYRDEIVGIMKKRTVQFTFASRAAFVLPTIAYVARLAGEPISLIDIGCSAGLITAFTEYAYDYGFGGRIGNDSAMAISGFRFQGLAPHALLMKIPEIGARVGIDLNPVDPSDPEERRWIDALCPPDMAEERAELRAALALRARINIPVIRGDALATLPAVLSSMPDPICILATHCLYQWPQNARGALDGLLCAASKGRIIYQVTIDHPGALDPLRIVALSSAADDVMPLEHEAVLTQYRDGRTSKKLLGRYDSFGRRGVWLAVQ